MCPTKLQGLLASVRTPPALLTSNMGLSKIIPGMIRFTDSSSDSTFPQVSLKGARITLRVTEEHTPAPQ